MPSKLKSLTKSSAFIYPLIIIIAIPLLLIVNTVWNLRSFNRDVNFVIRHQAVSIAETATPFLLNNLKSQSGTLNIINQIVDHNTDVSDVTVLLKRGNEFQIHATTDENVNIESLQDIGINQLAISMDQSFAGLVYDPFEQAKVWYVSIPLLTDTGDYVLLMKVKTTTVNQILARTSQDSFVVLGILVLITIVLLTNHIVFYKKSLEAKHLEEIDKLKDEFFSMAAHELRTPVTALVGYLEMLSDKMTEEDKEKVASELRILKSIIVNLNELINNLLEISRIEQGRIKIVEVETDLAQIVDKVIVTLTPVARQKNITLKHINQEIPKTISDPQRIQEILMNLVGNAVKYTLQGEVTASSVVKGGNIEIKIKDSGIGIPADHIPKLFSKFERVKDEKTKHVQGTGLGLWITKQLVERLGGNINVESIYGQGSVFTFTIPIKNN